MTKRTYEKTHPWIHFRMEAGKFDPGIWMALGEAASKAMNIAGIPLAPEVAQRLHLLFMAKGAQATTAIEGNTLSEKQVSDQIAGKLKLPLSQHYLQVEVQNVVDAYNRIIADLEKNGRRDITSKFIQDLNGEVLSNLHLEDGVLAGELRRHNVTVGTYKGAPAEDVSYLMDRMCEVLNEPTQGISREVDAILKALFAHIYIAIIHPFGDGNGRTARLLEYYIILQAGLPQPVGHLLSNHYNLTRSAYYHNLDTVSKSGGDMRSFIRYALGGFVDGLREQINTIKELQMEVAWQNYVHGKFHGKKSAADTRRRDLVLYLGTRSEPIKSADVENLSPDLAREFYGKTEKTIARDINALLEMGLLKRVDGRKISANKEAIRAFLPWMAQDRSSKVPR